MENLTINQDLLIELLKLGIENTQGSWSQGIKVNGGFVEALAILLKSKNEDFNMDLFMDKIRNGSSAYEDEIKETLNSILGIC